MPLFPTPTPPPNIFYTTFPLYISPRGTVPRSVESRPQLSYPELCDATRSRAMIRPRHFNQHVMPRGTDVLPYTFPSTSSCLLLLLLAIKRTTSRLKGRRPRTIVYQKQLEWCTPYCAHDNAAALVTASLAASSLRHNTFIFLGEVEGHAPHLTFLALKISPLPHLVITPKHPRCLSLGSSRPQPCS